MKRFLPHPVVSLALCALWLLLNQAVGQVRIFVGGDPDVPLADEDAVVAAMRASVWED